MAVVLQRHAGIGTDQGMSLVLPTPVDRLDGPKLGIRTLERVKPFTFK